MTSAVKGIDGRVREIRSSVWCGGDCHGGVRTDGDEPEVGSSKVSTYQRRLGLRVRVERCWSFRR
jgi:hypothetical protein